MEDIAVNAEFVNNPEDLPEQEIGPGSVAEAAVDVKPMLEGASDLEYVELLNPLSGTFVARVGVTKPTHATTTISRDINGRQLSEQDVANTYGITLTNKDVVGRMHIENQVRIGSGKTVRLMGDQAQVVIRQLTNEIMQRESKSLMMADPTARNVVEQRIIIRRGNVAQDLLGQQPVSVRDQLKQAVEESNEEFPELINQRTEPVTKASGDSTGTEADGGSRSEGTPAKSVKSKA